MVRFDEIREILRGTSDPFEACGLLIDRANQAGGHDNITVIVAQFDGEGLAESANEELRYRKYSLPESLYVPPVEPAPRSVREPSVPAVPVAAARQNSGHPAERISDHGPSRSKVTHTLLGAQMSQAALAALTAPNPEPPPSSAATWQEKPRALRDDAEPIFIPTSNAPAWMVGGVVLTALALALIAGYYLLR
jgi:protein phosphatase